MDEFSMYVCPECRKVFKVKGNNKKVKCSQCSVGILDMNIPMDVWKVIDKANKNNIIKNILNKQTGKSATPDKLSHQNGVSDVNNTASDKLTVKTENDNNTSSDSDNYYIKRLENEIRKNNGKALSFSTLTKIINEFEPYYGITMTEITNDMKAIIRRLGREGFNSLEQQNIMQSDISANGEDKDVLFGDIKNNSKVQEYSKKISEEELIKEYDNDINMIMKQKNEEAEVAALLSSAEKTHYWKYYNMAGVILSKENRSFEDWKKAKNCFEKSLECENVDEKQLLYNLGCTMARMANENPEYWNISINTLIKCDSSAADTVLGLIYDPLSNKYAYTEKNIEKAKKQYLRCIGRKKEKDAYTADQLTALNNLGTLYGTEKQYIYAAAYTFLAEKTGLNNYKVYIEYVEKYLGNFRSSLEKLKSVKEVDGFVEHVNTIVEYNKNLVKIEENISNVQDRLSALLSAAERTNYWNYYSHAAILLTDERKNYQDLENAVEYYKRALECERINEDFNINIQKNIIYANMGHAMAYMSNTNPSLWEETIDYLKKGDTIISLIHLGEIYDPKLDMFSYPEKDAERAVCFYSRCVSKNKPGEAYTETQLFALNNIGVTFGDLAKDYISAAAYTFLAKSVGAKNYAIYIKAVDGKYRSQIENLKNMQDAQNFLSHIDKKNLSTNRVVKPSVTLKDVIGLGDASRSESDSEFVKKVMNLPGADTWGTKREIIDLEKLMQNGEEVKAISSGYYDGRTWLFACTDRRILALNKNFLIGGDQVEIPFKQINAITINSGFATSDVTIHTGFKHMIIKTITNKSAKRFVDVIHAEMAAYENKSKAPAMAVSGADELRKYKSLLDEGIITQQEFEIKKKQLLGL